MLKTIVRRQLAAFEKAFGYDARYLHEMLDTSLRGFWRFSSITKMSAHREDVPLDAWHAAKIVAALDEDCGPCTQLAVTMAERDGVPAPVLRALLAGDDAALGRDAALAARFARASLARSADADVLRELVRQRWGPRALLSLALGMAAARVYPTVKYALGHGQTCVRIRVGKDYPVAIAGRPLVQKARTSP